MKNMMFGRNNGLRVSELALGTGTFGSATRRGATVEQAREIVNRFAEAGGTFLDTASNYQQGQSEEYLGQILGAQRERFVLASKYSRGSGRPGESGLAGNSRRSMVRSVEHSLRRLGTDYLDLLWAHYDDGVTPVDEILSSFDDLITAGKVLYGGLSNFAAWRVSRAQTIAEIRGRPSIVGIQVEHSLVERSAERELLPMADAFGIGAAVYSPLGGGFLTGKHRVGESSREGVVYGEDSDRRSTILDTVLDVSKLLDVRPAQLAIAWQRQHHRLASTGVATIVGPRTVEQLEEYLQAIELDVPSEMMEQLDSVSAITLGAPFDSVGGPTDLGDDFERFRNRAVPAN